MMYSVRSTDKQPARQQPAPSRESGPVATAASLASRLFAHAGPPPHLRLSGPVQRQETDEEPEAALAPEAVPEEDAEELAGELDEGELDEGELDEGELDEGELEEGELAEVQQSAEGPAVSDEAIRQAAQQGVQTPSVQLPFGGQIQQAFGRHDISGIQAHLSPQAAATASAMNAAAYATGQHVVLAGAPSLHTAAHEAAHVVQQRAGVQLTGGVGKVGDVYERQADAVADRVVAGQSAEELLPGPGPTVLRQDAPVGGAIQHVKFNKEIRDKILAANMKKHGIYTCETCGFQHAQQTYVKAEGGDRVGDGGFQADHVKHHSKGGGGNVRNGRVLCGTCNTSRGNRNHVGVTGMMKYGTLHRGRVTKKYTQRYLKSLKTRARKKKNAG